MRHSPTLVSSTRHLADVRCNGLSLPVPAACYCTSSQPFLVGFPVSTTPLTPSCSYYLLVQRLLSHFLLLLRISATPPFLLLLPVSRTAPPLFIALRVLCGCLALSSYDPLVGRSLPCLLLYVYSVAV